MSMNFLGIYLDFPFLRICVVKQSGKTLKILELKSIELTDSSHKFETDEKKILQRSFLQSQKKSLESEKPATSTRDVKQLYIHQIKGKMISALPSKSSFLRSMNLSIPKSKHLDEAVLFQTAALSYFKPEDVVLIPLIEKREKTVVKAKVITVSKEGLISHLNDLKMFDLIPDVVTTTQSALCTFIKWKFPTLENALIIDLGNTEISIGYLKNQRMEKSYAILKGVEDLLSALYQDRKRILLKSEIEGTAKQIDLLLLKPALNPRLSEALQGIRQELSKIFFSFTQNEVLSVIFTGQTDAFFHLKEYLLDHSDKEYPLTIEEQKFAIPIGLALNKMERPQIQLLQDEFFPQKNWKKLGVFALLLIFFSLILSTSLLLVQNHRELLSRKKMLNEIACRKPIDSNRSIDEQIGEWIKTIEDYNHEFTFISSAPKISELLSWLTTHPLLKEFEKMNDPIEIKKINYKLVSYPKIDNSKEPFLAKVDLEFNFKNAMNSRKFHEALRKGDTLVDPDLEMEWEVLNDSYRSSFFLKNRRKNVL